MRMQQVFRTVLGVTAITAVVGLQGCVADRPSRNGVFNENQYLRKDFLIHDANGAADPGWYMKATIVQTSTPNPMASLGLFTGAENAGALVRFVVTPNKLELADMRELSQSDAINNQNTRTPALVNAWPVTNVDLKYRINLDGEKTNFYEENQELDWQVRQWVKINFDKNDYSDVAGLGAYQEAFLQKCGTGDASATLVPGSFMVDEANDYMQWTVNASTAIKTDDDTCNAGYGPAELQAFQRMGRTTVSFNIMYSMARAKPVDPASYTPLVLSEKDSIRHKYGPIEITNWSRDQDSGLIAARQLTTRFNPSKPITFYFAKGYPDERKAMWTRANGIVDQTNALFQKAGAQARLSILNWNDLKTLNDAAGPARQYGDVRYNFIRWEDDYDTGSPFLAVTQLQPDLRTGELVSASINVADAPLKDFLITRTQAYLQSVIGADMFQDPPPDPTDPLNKKLPATCTSGQQIPIVPATVQRNSYGSSTLYQKMATYLPPAPSGATQPGPSDYVYNHTKADNGSFFKAYFAFIPFTTYADPMVNQFVTPVDLSTPTGATELIATLAGEAKFRKEMDELDHGRGLAALTPSGVSGMREAYAAVDNIRQLWQAHRDYTATWQLPRTSMRADTADMISFPATIARSSRHCVNGAWETRDAWQKALIDTYWEGVVWHEFGHVLGLEHNFMGSIDKANWPQYKDTAGNTQYGKYTSSIMEYSVAYDDVLWNNGSNTTGTPTTGWLPYDQGAIAFIYGNALSKDKASPQPIPAGATPGISGQASATAPWNDPAGFDGANEKAFLYCSHQHIRYTPLCRQFDLGSTPSEITASEIEAYEFNYKYRNFRNYYKTWDVSNYGASVANLLGEHRRFLAMEAFDWSKAELTDKLIRIGIAPPAGAPNAGAFYNQLTDQFVGEVDSSELLIGAFHEAIIQQSTGQRPFATAYDPYFGDVTQQGIATDKVLSFTQWLGLWPFDNFDPSQAAGYYGSAMTTGVGGTHPAQAWSTAGSMLGEKGPWDAYPSFFPSAVALFAHDTQSPTFTGLGYPQMRDWIGGHVFTRLQDALDYFRTVAAQNPLEPNGCASFASCTYNPMTPQTNSNDIGHSNPTTQGFIGPDHRKWVWVNLSDRNIWLFVDQERNSSSYFQVSQYNIEVNVGFDDGNPGFPTPVGPVYSLQAKVKYMIDAYAAFNNDTTAQ
jgi:Met-zincin